MGSPAGDPGSITALFLFIDHAHGQTADTPFIVDTIICSFCDFCAAMIIVLSIDLLFTDLNIAELSFLKGFTHTQKK